LLQLWQYPFDPSFCGECYLLHFIYSQNRPTILKGNVKGMAATFGLAKEAIKARAALLDKILNN
jgi:hypothetical protein